MIIALTGITGNLGLEVYSSLLNDNHTIIPIVRAADVNIARKKLKARLGNSNTFSEVLLADLLIETPTKSLSKIDCVVHCAGLVKFNDKKSSNERMTRNIVNFAQTLNVPIYHISTAYIYKSDNGEPRNNYEQDKIIAEEIVTKSTVPWKIFRPSILTGNSNNGHLVNLTGFSQVLPFILGAVNRSDDNKIRIPKFKGNINIIPVNIAADAIAKGIDDNMHQICFISNPEPGDSDYLVTKCLSLMKIRDKVEFINVPWRDFGKLQLTEIERKLYQFLSYFQPYWSGDHTFPNSMVGVNPVNDKYLHKVIAYMKSRNWK